jgi:two-component system chemotaxis sensor kinase CheA
MDIDRAQIVRTFLAETDDHLHQMEEALIALETEPQDAERLAAVFRFAHTLKGNAGVLELVAPEAFAHVLEGLLDRAREGTLPVTRGLVTLLLAAVDALRQMVPDAVAGAQELRPQHRALLEELTRATDGSVADQPAVPVPAAFPAQEGARTLRVDRDTLDRMLDLTGEIAVARARLRRSIDALGAVGAQTHEALEQTEQLCHGLQALVMETRMVSLGPTFRRYLRMVRDLAVGNGRVARLVTVGEDVAMDTSIIERLADPLTHLVRNALDHGIEPPAVRTAAGKDPCGTLTLRAFHQAGSVMVQVSDDGAGLDRDKILVRAREAGLVAPDATLSESEVRDLIFAPGFSTASSVTTLSGRGVGMDVVRRNIEGLRGTISIDSQPGAGTTVTLRLPLTLAIIEGLAVGVGDETYILPIEAVVECVDLPEAEHLRPEAEGVVGLRGRSLPYVRLRHLFGVSAGRAAREQVVVVRRGDELAGIAVDVLRGESQTVVKPLDRTFRHHPSIAGSTVLPDGRVAFIVDVAVLLECAVRDRAAA